MTTSLTPDTGSGSGAGAVDTTPPAAPGGRTAAASSRRRPPARPTWRRVAFGADQPLWVRPSAFGLLVASGFLYLWNLTNSGWANEFYAAAIQAGSKDWTAWFFGSLDAGNAITVDKPPAAFWIPGLLGRIFGFNAFTMLLPEALMGVASVALMYAAVKRVSGPAAGLIAGGALAATPVAALMFRFNNPDAMLTFCLVLAASMTVRAIEKAGWKWLVGAGAVLGLAFLTKMLAGLIIVPALGLAYLWAAPTTLRRRILHLLGALGGLIAVAGAYIAAFTLTPTTVRPYMAGSQTNSFLELTFGYNGLARIFGNRGGGFGGAVRDRASDAGAAAGPGAAGGAGLGGFAGGAPGGGGPGGGNSMFGGSAGLARMFGSSFGTEISWLLPAALILLVAGLWFTRRAARTDRVRASLIVWGGWTVLTAAVFSFMTGTVHSYYAIALAPGIAGVVGLGAAELWRGRAYWPSRIVLAVVVLGTSLWAAVLLGRDASWLPWLRVVIVVLGVLAALGFLVRADRFGAGGFGASRVRAGRFRAGAVALAATALLAGGLGPAAFTVATASVGHSGAIPTSGPSGAGGSGARAGFAQFRDRLGATRDGSPAEAFGGSFGGQPQGGPGGGGSASSEVVALLKQTTTKWSAITNGSNSAASLELASNTDVIAMGGFTGSDPYPSLDEFKNLVAKGDVTYYIAGGGMGGGFGGRGGVTTDASAITQWVEANFQPQTVGSTTVYKLVK
jgi:4-amino-4-deoxy-L-arabinose transferase-like glycosyltransferase